MSNVLIATATYADKMRKETIDSVQAQVFDGVWQWRQYRENPFPYGDRRNYFAQYDAIRTDMLNGDFDAILFVEHDMEVPPDALQKLWDTGDQVAYGVYLLRHGIEILNTYRWVSNQGIGESLSLYAQQLEAARAQVVAEVSGIGFGCTLIRRETLERIPFRPDESRGAPDMPFAIDCVQAGIKQIAHFGVLCGHWDEGKRLYPFAGGRASMQLVRALETVNISLSNGGAAQIEEGKEYHLPVADAREHVRTGLIEFLDTPEEGKGRILVSANPDPNIRPAPPDATTKPAKPRKPKRQGL